MSNIKLSLLFIGLFAPLLTSCSWLQPYEAPLTQGTVIDQEALNTLQPGLTQDQVISLLGPAYGQNPYHPNLWEYVFYTSDASLHPEAARHLTVTFDHDGYVTAWQLMEDKVKINRKTIND